MKFYKCKFAKKKDSFGAFAFASVVRVAWSTKQFFNSIWFHMMFYCVSVRVEWSNRSDWLICIPS